MIIRRPSAYPECVLRNLPDTCAAELDEPHLILLLLVALEVVLDQEVRLLGGCEGEGDEDMLCQWQRSKPTVALAIGIEAPFDRISVGDLSAVSSGGCKGVVPGLEERYKEGGRPAGAEDEDVYLLHLFLWPSGNEDVERILLPCCCRHQLSIVYCLLSPQVPALLFRHYRCLGVATTP